MKKHYRVYLNSNHSTVQQIALLACSSNFQEGDLRVTIHELETVFKVNGIQSPTLNKGLQLKNINGKELTIDEGTTCLLHIEEIELLELKIDENE